MFGRSAVGPAVMGGRACIRGMRMTVSLVVNLVANGMSIEDIIREYPELEAEDIRQALPYASELTNEKTGLFKSPAALRFLADMGVSITTVEALRAASHDAVHLREETRP